MKCSPTISAGEGTFLLSADREQQSGSTARHDRLLLIGVPLLLLTGAILGLVHVLAWISLVAAVIGG